jgi:long-chain fatty acid transport protein
MEKRGLVVVIVCVVTAMQTGIVYAGGYESPMLGSRVLGISGAFIGTADDWTAVYWNPAGLAQQEKWGVGATVFNPRRTLTDGNSVSNYDAPQQSFYQRDVFMRVHPTLSGAGGEPAQFSKKTMSRSDYSPGIGGYLAIPSIGVLGFGAYTPVSSRVDWDDAVKDLVTQADITASYYSRLSMSMVNLSFARDIIRNLSAGIGLNLVYGKSEYDADKKYTSAAVPPMNYTFDYDSEASGEGFEWMLGLRYEVIPQLSIGAVYRSGSKLSLSGTANTSHTMLGIDETSDYTQKFYHPATYGVGLAYRPISKLLLGADWTQADWTTMRAELDYENEGRALKDIDKSIDWERSDSYKFGVEYTVSEQIRIRAGYGKGFAAVPDKGVGLTSANDVDKNTFSLGAGYDFKGFQIDAAYLHSRGERTADNVEYKIEANVFTLTVAYSF